MIAGLSKTFFEKYGAEPLIVRSPGRVNIIGEHTDYNLGFVLPAAIDKAIYIAISKRNDAEIHLYAGDLAQSFETNTNTLQPSDQQWPNFILGVADQLIKAGHAIGGFNAVV